MNTLLLIALFSLALVFLGVRFSKRNSAKVKKSVPGRRRKQASESLQQRPAFAAVSIDSNADACPAVRDLQGQRFLEREAPIMPLGECSRAKCRCTYIHYDDRRSAEDRRDSFATGPRLSEFKGTRDRRSNRERRKTDSGDTQRDFGYRELLRAAVEEESK